MPAKARCEFFCVKLNLKFENADGKNLVNVLGKTFLPATGMKMQNQEASDLGSHLDTTNDRGLSLSIAR